MMNLTEKATILKKEEEPISRSSEKNTFQKFISNSFLHMSIKRGIFYFVVFFIAITLAFLLPRLVPGNVLGYIYERPQGTSPEAWAVIIANLEEYLGLNYPLEIQYINFLRSFFFEFDLGYSVLFSFEPVTNIVLRALPYTMMLVIPVLIISFFTGNWIGARTGYTNSKKDKVFYYIFMVLQTAPFFWMAYVFLDIFVLKLNWFPWGQSVPNWAWDWDAISTIFDHFWLPFIILSLTNIGGWATGAHALMTYEKGEDYISYGRKLGFSDNKLRKYAYRNSMLPQFTGLNLRFNGLIGSTLITEIIFRFPGLGYTMYDAFQNFDYALIIGSFIVTILVVVIGNYLIDMSYGILDPRIRVGGKGEA
ncbi:MAG: ABC transporter permease [Candidatus Lokiarchaeota archaeon]|nr:ABC transporter permease [Candidatus Lokiarchaeota archaeon]